MAGRIGAYADPTTLDAVDTQIEQGQQAADEFHIQAQAARTDELNSLRQSFMQTAQQNLARFNELNTMRKSFMDAVTPQPQPAQPTPVDGPSTPGQREDRPGAAASNQDIQQATQTAQSAGVPSSILARAKAQLGSNDYINLCEKFVENISDKSGLYSSALADAQSAPLSKDWNSIQPGDSVFFDKAAENGGYGHIGVYSGNGNIVSATSHGVKELPLTAFQAPILGYRPDGTQQQIFAGQAAA